MLGKHIVSLFSTLRGFDVFACDRVAHPGCDEKKQILGDLTSSPFLNSVLCDVKPNVIVHCAAIVDVDACGMDKDAADAIHCGVVRRLSSFNPALTQFVNISTDSVFDGLQGNYSETDIPNPLNYYAKSKLAGEQIALENNPNSVIIRTNIFGFNYHSGASLVDWALEGLLAGQPIVGFNDVFFNPLYTRQLARCIAEIIEKEFAGVINIATDERVSKFDFLLRLAQSFNLSLDLIQADTVESVKFLAPRPKDTFLNTELMKSAFGWEFTIAQGLKELRNDYADHFGSTV